MKTLAHPQPDRQPLDDLSDADLQDALAYLRFARAHQMFPWFSPGSRPAQVAAMLARRGFCRMTPDTIDGIPALRVDWLKGAPQ
jgi:hypothetical protein